MFKYDQFPILKLQVYNKQGHLQQKTLRQKSHKPYLQAPTHNLINIIDFETSEHLTLKTIYKTKTMSKDTIIAEISNQQKINKYCNFIKIRQVYQDHHNIYIMMEENYMNLQEVLEKRVTLFQREVQYIFCQLVTILENLRAMNIFHGGICLKNLYLDPNTMRIKLSGFGHSINLQKVKMGTHLNLYSQTELTPYTAPELLDNSIDNAEMYYAGDIWSVGVVLYALLIGEQPFTYMDQNKKLRTPSIVKLKNYTYQFPTLSLSLSQKKGSINIPLNQSTKKLPKQPITHQYNTKGSITKKWKQLLKHIFTPKQRRITLHKLIEHQFNLIVQSKFREFTCQNVPDIRKHWVCRQEESGYVDMGKVVCERDCVGKSLVFPKLFFTSKYQQLPTLPSILSNQPTKQLLTGGQLNTLILKLCLQQTKSPENLPLICRQPGYIQKYCYIQKQNCIGYILQNNIGVIYSDGSCTIGQNQTKYTYLSNESDGNLDEILRMYIGLYDEFYGGSCCKQVDRYGTGGSQSDYVNQQSSNNINPNIQSNNTSNNNTSNNTSRQSPKPPPTSTQPQKTNMSSSSPHHTLKSKKSKMLEILPYTHFHAHTSSNPNSNCRSANGFYQKGHHKLNSSGSGSLHKGVSINQNLQFNLNTGININSTHHINTTTTNINNTPINQFTKIGQSYLASSYYYNNSGNSIKKSSQISKNKYEIYKYFVQYFGDRVVDYEKKDWVIGFWKIQCGVIFLYNSGHWQININQGIHHPNTNTNTNTNTNQSNLNQKQSAVLIDKYGLAWWLKSNQTQPQPQHPHTTNLNLNLNLNYNQIDQNPTITPTTSPHTKGCINDDYNYLCVKIGRKMVRDIRGLFVGEFEDMMQPYCYR